MQHCLPVRLSANLSTHSYFWQIVCLSVIIIVIALSIYYLKLSNYEDTTKTNASVIRLPKRHIAELRSLYICMCVLIYCYVYAIILIQLDYSLCCLDCVHQEWNVNNNLGDFLCGFDSQQQQEQPQKKLKLKANNYTQQQQHT